MTKLAAMVQGSVIITETAKIVAAKNYNQDGSRAAQSEFTSLNNCNLQGDGFDDNLGRSIESVSGLL